jgi:hypothetical protein
LIVALPQTINVDRPGEIGGRLELIKLLAHEKGVGTQIDKTLAFYQRRHNLTNLPMNERLPASDGDDWRAAFLNRVDTLLNRESPRKDIIGMLNFATASTGKVALIKWF